ncbi:MAG: hypothetical protein ACR2RE_04610 [Geminicoccaceae bacterium]
MTIPGIGPTISGAIVAAVGDARALQVVATSAPD